jgi:hypothetical protein
LDKLREAFRAVRKENLEGRLYPTPDDPTVRLLLNSLVECDLVMVVDPTPTSLGGYVAHGVYGFASAAASKVAQA